MTADGSMPASWCLAGCIAAGCVDACMRGFGNLSSQFRDDPPPLGHGWGLHGFAKEVCKRGLQKRFARGVCKGSLTRGFEVCAAAAVNFSEKWQCLRCVILRLHIETRVGDFHKSCQHCHCRCSIFDIRLSLGFSRTS
jgi:hypothetical protein